MKRNIEFMGRKISVMAIVVALLVISTASATVYTHYATTQGSVTIESPITVTVNGAEILLGHNHNYTFESMSSPCTISETLYFNNTHGSALNVSLLWMLYEDNNPDPFNASTSYWIWDNETYLVPMGKTSHPVSLDVPAYMMDEYIFSIEVNPYVPE